MIKSGRDLNQSITRDQNSSICERSSFINSNDKFLCINNRKIPMSNQSKSNNDSADVNNYDVEFN